MGGRRLARRVAVRPRELRRLVEVLVRLLHLGLRRLPHAPCQSREKLANFGRFNYKTAPPCPKAVDRLVKVESGTLVVLRERPLAL